MTPLSHDRARQWIEQATDGLLSAEQQRQLDEHLQGCVECRAYAEQLKALESALQAALVANLGQPSLPPQAVDSLVERLQQQGPRGGNGSGGGSAGGGFLKLMGILMALGLAALGIFYGPTILAGGAPTATPTEQEQSAPTSTTRSTATPTATASATATRTPAQADLILVAIPIQNVNCREGNSSQFEIADTLFEGAEYVPDARGFDELWVRFFGPVNQVYCWVFADNLTLLVNDQETSIEAIPESLLPYLPYPPTPTVPPTATFTPQPSIPECRDGIDNDGDNRVDFDGGPQGLKPDRECSSPEDNNEAVQ